MDELYWTLGVYSAILVLCLGGVIEYIYFRFGIDQIRERLASIDESLKVRAPRRQPQPAARTIA